MLYMIYRANDDRLAYRGGQRPVVHLVSTAEVAAEWAAENDLRWAFTDAHAAAAYSITHTNLDRLAELDWDAINARNWIDRKSSKQAEFLVERCFPWASIEEIGVYSEVEAQIVSDKLINAAHRPAIRIRREWYY